MSIIKGDKVSLDCSTIWAWFKDCKYANSPKHNNRKCKRHRSRDRDASWTYDKVIPKDLEQEIKDMFNAFIRNSCVMLTP